MRFNAIESIFFMKFLFFVAILYCLHDLFRYICIWFTSLLLYDSVLTSSLSLHIITYLRISSQPLWKKNPLFFFLFPRLLILLGKSYLISIKPNIILLNRSHTIRYLENISMLNR